MKLDQPEPHTTESLREFPVRLGLLGTSEATPIKSHKHELSKDSNNVHSKVGEPTRPQPYTKNYRSVKNVKSRKSNPPQGRKHKWVIQFQAVIPETDICVALYRLSRA